MVYDFEIQNILISEKQTEEDTHDQNWRRWVRGLRGSPNPG